MSVENSSTKQEATQPSVSEDLLLLAVDAIRKSIEQTVRQLRARRVRSEMKLRWSRSLIQQVEGLIKVAEALEKLGSKSSADLDLSSYLSVVQEKVPREFESRTLSRIFRRYQIRGLEHATRRRI